MAAKFWGKTKVPTLTPYTSYKIELCALLSNDAFSSQARTLQDMVLILLARRPLLVRTELQKPSRQRHIQNPMCFTTQVEMK